MRKKWWNKSVSDYVRVKRAYDVAVLQGEQVSAQELLRVQKEWIGVIEGFGAPSLSGFCIEGLCCRRHLVRKESDCFLVAVEVVTEQGTIFFNDTFGGKQMKIYSSQTLFEQFFKGKAIDRILDDLDYEEFEKLKLQQKLMKQQKGINQRRKS